MLKHYVRTAGDKVKHALRSPKALPVLGGLSFAESFIVPIITDPLLAAVVIAKPGKWLRAAIVTALASVAGALCAYVLGAFLWKQVGDSILNFFHATDAFNRMSLLAGSGAFLFPLIGTVTPVPFKITAIVSGVFGLNPFLFALATLLGRGGRYLIVAYGSAAVTRKIQD